MIHAQYARLEFENPGLSVVAMAHDNFSQSHAWLMRAVAHWKHLPVERNRQKANIKQADATSYFDRLVQAVLHEDDELDGFSAQAWYLSGVLIEAAASRRTYFGQLSPGATFETVDSEAVEDQVETVLALGGEEEAIRSRLKALYYEGSVADRKILESGLKTSRRQTLRDIGQKALCAGTDVAVSAMTTRVVGKFSAY